MRRRRLGGGSRSGRAWRCGDKRRRLLPEDLCRIGKAEAKRIFGTLENRVAKLDDPRQLGSALSGEISGLWRWRIGGYRVVARMEDERITILVVRVAHRREVYR
jgi:mRNA interferase RelE/StbE